MTECTVTYKSRGKSTTGKKAHTAKALRLEAAIITTDGSHLTHTCKFNWNNLDERWAFIHRMGDVLEQGGYAVAIKRVDPKAERLLQKFPGH